MRTPAELRAAYEDGATVEELALDEFCKPDKIRRLLREAGTTMRSVGMRPGTKKNNPTRDFEGVPGPAIKTSKGRRDHRGHRRRRRNQ